MDCEENPLHFLLLFKTMNCAYYSNKSDHLLESKPNKRLLGQIIRYESECLPFKPLLQVMLLALHDSLIAVYKMG